MLEQILEPGQEEEKEEKPGFLKLVSLLPGFGILLAIGCVLVGQVREATALQTDEFSEFF